MTATINTAHISQFSDNIYTLLQQRGSKARRSVDVEMAKGKRHFFDRIGSFTATEVVDRRADTDLQDAPHSRRMAVVREYHAGTYLSDLDKFKMLIDPTNAYALRLADSHGRNLDDVIWSAALGTAATGEDGTGTQAFDTTNQQIAHGSTTLTIPKVNEAMGILEANEVDLDVAEIFLAVGADGLNNGLMADTEFTSVDYQDVKALAGRQVPSFRGLTLIRSQRIPDETSGTTKRALMYTSDCIKLAVARNLDVKTAERADKNFNYQVSTYMMMGAVRMEEKCIVDVLYQ